MKLLGKTKVSVASVFLPIALALGVLTSVMIGSPDFLRLEADGESPYTYVLNSANAPATLPASYAGTSVNTSVATALGNPVSLDYHDAKQAASAHVSLNATTGYLANTSKISGMSSITVTFTGTLYLRYGLTTDNLSANQAISSGVAFPLSSTMDYFKLVAGSSEAIVTSFSAAYSCSSRVVIPSGATAISNVTEFNAFFDTGAAHTASNAYLTANIDLGTAERSNTGMAGEFSGIIEGQGYTVKNWIANGNKALFNIVSTTGRIRNLNFEITQKGAIGFGGLCYQNNGIISDSNVKLTLQNSLSHTYGAFSLPASGSFIRCHSDIIANINGCHDLYPISQHAQGTLTSCSYSLSGTATDKTTASPYIMGSTGVTNVAATFTTVTSAIDKTSFAVDESAVITGTITNIPAGGSATWSFTGSSGYATYATVTQDSVDLNKFNLVGVSNGSFTITVTATVDGIAYSAPALSVQVLTKVTVAVSKNPIQVSETSVLTGTYYDSGKTVSSWSFNGSDGYSTYATITQDGTNPNKFNVVGVANGTFTVTLSAVVESVTYTSAPVSITVGYIIPEGATAISNYTQFAAFFNGSAENYNKSAYLTADIDCGGATRAMGMAGEYTGTFEGQGHTISNFTASQPLFNILGSVSEVRNVNLSCTFTGSGYGALAFQNNGNIHDCIVTVTINSGINTFGGFVLVGSSGTFTNLHTNFVINAGGAVANTLYPICQNDGSATGISNCSYSFSGTEAGAGDFVTSNSHITLIS